MSMSQAATAVHGDCAVASSLAPWCHPATVAGMTHGEDFVGDVLLSTDVAAGRCGTMNGLSESMLASPKPEERGATFLEGPTGALSCSLATQAGWRKTQGTLLGPGLVSRLILISFSSTNSVV